MHMNQTLHMATNVLQLFQIYLRFHLGMGSSVQLTYAHLLVSFYQTSIKIKVAEPLAGRVSTQEVSKLGRNCGPTLTKQNPASDRFPLVSLQCRVIILQAEFTFRMGPNAPSVVWGVVEMVL